MNKGDYVAVASALRELHPYMRHKLRAYRVMVRFLAARNPSFDPMLFGSSMGIPRLLVEREIERTEEEKKNASTA